MSMGSKKAEYGQYIPEDVKGLRGQQLNFLNSILGGGGANSQQFQNFFGNLSNPTSDLQRQSAGGISQFLNQPAPEQRAFDVAMPAIQNILGGAPGQGVIDAMQPSFQKNLAQANQQGGRFGSGNLAMRGNAVNDFNLLSAQAAQQGQQTQLQAANALGVLGSMAGQNPFQRLQGAYGVGSDMAGQADLETQRRLQILMQMLGVGQQTAFNLPIQQQRPYDQGWGRTLLDGGVQIATAGAGSIAGAMGGGGGK